MLGHPISSDLDTPKNGCAGIRVARLGYIGKNVFIPLNELTKLRPCQDRKIPPTKSKTKPNDLLEKKNAANVPVERKTSDRRSARNKRTLYRRSARPCRLCRSRWLVRQGEKSSQKILLIFDSRNAQRNLRRTVRRSTRWRVGWKFASTYFRNGNWRSPRRHDCVCGDGGGVPSSLEFGKTKESLDIYHALEKLSDCGKVLFGTESEECETWRETTII